MTKTPDDKDNNNNKINKINTRSNYKKRKLKLLELDEDNNPINQRSKRAKIEYNIIINNPILSYIIDENMKEKFGIELKSFESEQAKAKAKKEKNMNINNNIELAIEPKTKIKTKIKKNIDKDLLIADKKEVSEDEKSDKSIKMIVKKKSNPNNILKRLLKFKGDTLRYYLSLDRNKRDLLKLKQKEVDEYFNKDIPIRFKILESDLNISSKVVILNKLDIFENMRSFDSEYGKMKNWTDYISRIPFNNYVDIPIKISDPIDKINNFITDIKKQLDSTIYGQERAKGKLLQIIAQWISNPKSKSSYIALEGPPGVGKTSLIKNGVSKSFNRPFNFIALGGATDSSFLDGHSYTYEGATYGKIVEILIQSKVMNPIIFFDELDKISMTVKGDEVNGILTHLTDMTQNNCFNDKFFSGIDFDLSRSMLFFSYNDIEKINPILRDRLTIIKFESYKTRDKVKIAKKYLIPELFENINMNQNDLIFDDKIIEYIIEKYASNEKGVRNLKRSLEEIFMKINLMRLTIINSEDKVKVIDTNTEKPKESSKEERLYSINNFKLPLILTTDIVNNLLKEFEKPELSFSVQRMYL